MLTVIMWDYHRIINKESNGAGLSQKSAETGGNGVGLLA